MEIIDILGLPIKTLSISQLLNRKGWTTLKNENILEIADNGYFGLYFKPSKLVSKNSRKDPFFIKMYLKTILQSKNTNAAEKENYKKLAAQYVYFCKNHKFLLKPKEGFLRLATTIETQILSSCETGAIAELQKESKIRGTEWCNHFGFVFLKGGIVSPSIYFQGRSILIDDLFVFVSEIETFEKHQDQISKHISINEDQTTIDHPLPSRSIDITDAQLLSRSAIKANYSNGIQGLHEGKWKNLFDNENKNGLVEARIKKASKKVYYSRSILESWLIKEGYFTKAAIEKIKHPSLNQNGVW